MGLYRVPAAGGEPKILANPNQEKGRLEYPEILPGGKTVLLTLNVPTLNKSQIVALSLETGEQKILLEGARQAHYAPTGHLVYALAGTGTLMAVPFDPARLEVTGDSVPILEGIRQEGSVDYALSDAGTLAYIPAGGASAELRLLWVDRKGIESPVTEEKRAYENPSLSPDGKQVALNVSDNVWIYDFERDSFNRLTFEGEINEVPIWTPDGKWITFSSTRDGQRNLYRKPADGSGSAERLTTSEFNQIAYSWSPHGTLLAFGETRPDTRADILILPVESDAKPQPFVSTPATECCARFSPDGKWLAYVSMELGQQQVYVRPYPESDAKWLVSGEEGGDVPVWSPDGSELFYRSGNRMMVVSVQTKPTFSMDKPRVLFEGSYFVHARRGVSPSYDISPDGQRFLMIKEAEGGTQIHVVLNWFEELKRLVSTN
ncbi:hypothetical protein MYX65_12965 [Acidobacteria bacterium AH-259-L09]|nr:hypothetical protein [Acidobacteria bacterium AH-259-L09]